MWMMKTGDDHGIANGLDRGCVDIVVKIDHRSASNTTSMSDAKDNIINMKYCCCRKHHT